MGARSPLVAVLLVLSACGSEAPRPAAPADPPPKDALPPWARVSAEQLAEAGRLGVPAVLENAIGMRIVLVPAGTFTMGSPPSEADREATETAHLVTLTRAYYLQTTEVTNRQYRLFRPDHSSGAGDGGSLDGDEQPVVSVPWSDAAAFARWLSREDPRLKVRLPTEAEWERACRAGTSSVFWWGASASTDRANFAPGPARGVTLPVGRLPANPWGLHDLHGNASEWCADRYDDLDYPPGPATDPTGPAEGDARVRRGGAYDGEAAHMLRAAFRSGVAGGEARSYVGFRLAAFVPLR